MQCVLVTLNDADTDTGTDTDILVDFRARIVHEPDTHEDPRRLVQHARLSSRGCPLEMRTCTRTCIVRDKLSCTRLQNYTTRIPNVGVRVGVGPMQFQLMAMRHRASSHVAATQRNALDPV